MEVLRINTPLNESIVLSLKAGQRVLINGKIFTARDAAHKRMIALLQEGKPLPIDIRNQIIYYVGPSPAKPGRIIGAAGPTTSGRMDAYTPQLIALGLKGMIGKGYRSPEVEEAMRRYKAVYFAAVGGAGALLSRCIKAARVVAYPELGPEAIHEFEVVDFPAVVAIDAHGNSLYRQGRASFAGPAFNP
ncbi:MAG: Fe-S-containing hydro-lyase [Bacillota bacterium]|uniref:Fe-S-containing hydro-lyase n=1 Tax=Desulforudis sp. DRI-14 TaxID=3459793 RepID=UPI00348D11E8